MAPDTSHPTLKQAAVSYATAGWEVFPAHPQTKAPLTTNGHKAATTDLDQIRRWWNDTPDALIACRIPPHLLVLDIDPRHGGHTTLERLAELHGPIAGTTRLHLSGRGDGGHHIWLTRPPGRITSSQLDKWAEQHGTGERIENSGRHVSGIDILRHEHRYSILPPSPHPETGRPYTWVNSPHTPPAPCPDWLADLIVTPDQPQPTEWAREDRWDDDSIADWYSSNHHWSELLPRHGWTCVAGDGNQDGSQWRHPNATSACSATIRHNCLFVYSPNTPFEVTEPDHARGYTTFRAWGVLAWGGDLTAAAAAAHELRDPPPDTDKWVRDIVAAGAEPEPPPPDPLRITWVRDINHESLPKPKPLVHGLIDRGEFTVIAAERNLGKSWWVLNLAKSLSDGTDFLRAHKCDPGVRTLIVDGEANLAAIWQRLITMHGWKPGQPPKPEHAAILTERPYIRVLRRRSQRGAYLEDELIGRLDERLETAITEHRFDVVILDPWATIFRGNENSNDEVEAALDELHQLAQRTGVTIILVHHFAKALEARQPEDMWRGASRLADWAANRITLTFAARKHHKNLPREELRRWIHQDVLRRNAIPPAQLTLRRNDAGMWIPTDIEELDAQAGMVDDDPTLDIAIVNKLTEMQRQAGGALVEVKGISKLARMVGRNPPTGTDRAKVTEAARRVAADGSNPIEIDESERNYRLTLPAQQPPKQHETPQQGELT